MNEIEEDLIKAERAADIWSLTLNNEYRELRQELVEKYGEEPMRKKEEQLLKKWEREINEKDQRQERR